MPKFIQSTGGHDTSVNLELVKNIRLEKQEERPVIVFEYDPSFIIKWVYTDDMHFDTDVKRLKEFFV